MIDNAYTLLLLDKVTDAVIARLGKTGDDGAAREDLARIQRLTSAGQVPKQKRQVALERVANNESLSEELRAEATEELKTTHPKRRATLPDSLERPDPTSYASSDALLPGDWPADDLTERGWSEIRGREIEDFLGQITPVDGVLLMSPETSRCHWRQLPWYDDVQLIRIHDPRFHDRKLALYYLTLQGNLFRLNGTSPPIHAVNTKAPIRLDEDNVLDYLRFFCFFVHGEEGPFFVVERPDDPLVPKMDESETARKVLAEVHPATLGTIDEAGRFHCKVTLFYSNAIFRADMTVAPTGMIEMSNDEAIGADLPGKIEAPLAWKDG